LTFWWLQWQSAPAAAKSAEVSSTGTAQYGLHDGDAMLGDGLRAGLRQLGFQVDWVRDGIAAERELAGGDYTAAVLDLGLPLKDGIEVLRALRARKNTTPILVLTARDAVPDRIVGLDWGYEVDSNTIEVHIHHLRRKLSPDLIQTVRGIGYTLLREQALLQCTIAGDETLVAVLVRNLIDNAIRYTPQGGQIQISVLCESGHAILRVEDSGPGMTNVDTARLGERFFRVLGTNQTGSGLGWSIVKRIAQASDARVQTSHSELLGGLAVSVTWSRPTPI